MSFKFLGEAYDAVIFDCDGVLADSEPYWHRAELRLCAEYGRGYPSGANTKGETMVGTIRKLLPDLHLENEIQKAMHKYVEFARQELKTNVQGLPGAAEFLQGISRFCPVGVASNSPRVVLDEVLFEIGVSEFVSISMSGDEVTSGKPAPDIYLQTKDRLAPNSKRILVFEDSLIGVHAASAAGFEVVQMLGPAGKKIHEPKPVA